MPLLTLILELNKLEEMILNRWAMYYYILLKDNYLGKEYQQEPKKKNMKKSETKNYLLKLNN
jgi:hypothetical protein